MREQGEPGENQEESHTADRSSSRHDRFTHTRTRNPIHIGAGCLSEVGLLGAGCLSEVGLLGTGCLLEVGLVSS